MGSEGGLVISPTAFGGISLQGPWRPNPAPRTHPTHPGTSLGVKVALRGRGFGVLARAVALCGRQRCSQGGFGAGWGRRGGHTGQSRWVNGCGHIPQVHWGGGAPQRASPWRVGPAWWRAGSGELRRIFISAPMCPIASAGALGDGVFCVSLGSYFPKKRSRRGGRAAGGGRADT